MFQIFAAGKLLHDPAEASSAQHTVIQPVLREEVNGFGSLSFRLPPENPKYGTLEERKTYVSVTDDSGERWRGRVILSKRCWDNTIETECEGELSFLCDSTLRPFTYYGTVEGLFQQLITAHNAQMKKPDGTTDTDRTFAAGVCNVPQEDPTEQFYRASESAKSTWQLLRDKLLQPLGGYLRVRIVNGVRTLDYIDDFPDESGQTVEYGKNMITISVERSEEQLITVLIPYGARYEPGDSGYVDPPSANTTWDGNRRTVRSVNRGSDEVANTAAIAKYGRIYGTKTWDSVYSEQTLLERARDWLAEQCQPEINITARAVDLSFIDAALDPIRIGMYVRTVSQLHDVDCWLLCVKQTIYLMDLAKGEIELGTANKTLTDRIGGTT